MYQDMKAGLLRNTICVQNFS